VGEPIVVTGPPGAGKSTVSAHLVELYEPSALVEGDAFFAFLRRGYIEPWKPSSHEQNTVVVEAAAAAVGRLSGHCSVVYDGVVGPWFLPAFLAASGVSRLHYVVLLPPLEVCVSRVERRTGHGFTDLTATRQMYEQFAAATQELSSHVVSSDLPAQDLAALIHREATNTISLDARQLGLRRSTRAAPRPNSSRLGRGRQ
jgi:cytidylate kinase